jgi:hypothetical protein
MLNVSLSSVKLFRACEEAYYNRYVRRLQRVDKATYLIVGSLIHDYLKGYYSRLKDGDAAQHAHVEAFTEVINSNAASLKADLEASFASGNEKRVAELQQVIPSLHSIIPRYYTLRGKSDAERYIILAVEEPLKAKVGVGIRNTSVLDLLTEERWSGRVSLWEHKSAASIPDSDVRLTDLQTVLYKPLAEARFKRTIDTVTWNYLRTKLPAVPDLLKAGALTRRQDLDTTWPTYAEAIKTHNLDEQDYVEMKERLANRELEAYFPRFELPFMADAKLLLRDYRTTAQLIRARERSWAEKKSTPVRNFSFSCGRCEYLPICKAVLMGGEVNDVVRIKYRTSTRQNEEKVYDHPTSGDQTDPGWSALAESLQAR